MKCWQTLALLFSFSFLAQNVKLEWVVLCSYEALVLVAGGIGVSPFVAIIRDLLQRYKRDQHNLPSHVTLIWAVQKSEELQLLDFLVLWQNWEAEAVLLFINVSNPPHPGVYGIRW